MGGGSGIDAREKSGYLFWGPVAAVVAYLEIAAATNDFRRKHPLGWVYDSDQAGWPTISSTVGHLEDINPGVGVIVVAVVAIAAYYAVTGAKKAVADEGLEHLGEKVHVGKRSVWLRYDLSTPLLGVALGVGLALLLADEHKPSKYEWGYALYGSMAVFGILLPLFFHRFVKRSIDFPTLFETIRDLRGHVRVLAVFVLAGLSILMLHLAFYPWPDLNREASRYAGLSPAKARDVATKKVDGLSATRLFYTSQVRGRNADGKEIWLVYFNPPNFPAETSKCVVVLEKDVPAVASSACA